MAAGNMLRLRGRALRVFFIAVIALVGLHFVWNRGSLESYRARLPRPRPGEGYKELTSAYTHQAIDYATSVILGHEVGQDADHAQAEDDHHEDDHHAPASSSSSSAPPHASSTAHETASSSASSKLTTGTTDSSETLLPCYEADGMQDIVYIIKTGSTEALERLPVHFNTTMKCFPHVLIFSDYAETMDRHTIHDALDNVIDQIRLEEDDFELWRRLRAKGRADLRPDELSDHHHVADPNSGGGQPDNGGWRLDKFKNVPMVGKTLALYPKAKWYLYTDADTFISWSNLARWTKMLDPEKSLYLGSPAVIDDQVFGHGGSGYLLSHPAMKKVADFYHDNQEEWDRFAAQHWAGDCVLASALEQRLDTPLTWAFPIIQGGDPTLQDFSEYGYDRQIWCYPTVSYHHLTPATIQSLWSFEQNWTAAHTKSKPLRHQNTFKEWAMPQMVDERRDWDNASTDEVDELEANTLSSCRAHCERNSTCMQYVYGEDKCRTHSTYPRLGNDPRPGYTSGWMTARVGDFASALDGKCASDGDWITS